MNFYFKLNLNVNRAEDCGDDIELRVLGWHIRDTVTSAEAWLCVALRPQKPFGSLGRKAQDGHLDFHTAPELCWRRTSGGDHVPCVYTHARWELQ